MSEILPPTALKSEDFPLSYRFGMKLKNPGLEHLRGFTYRAETPLGKHRDD
jgi:hypothetical protein